MIKQITWEKLRNKQLRATDRVNQVTQEIRKFYVNDSVVEIRKGTPQLMKDILNLSVMQFLKKEMKERRDGRKEKKFSPPLNTLQQRDL